MFSFRRFDRSTALFLTLLVLSFLLATFDVRAQGTGVGGSLREGAQTLFSPVQRLATAVTRPVAGLIDGVSNIAGLRDDWPVASVVQVQAALQDMRVSRVSLRRQAYHALRDLTHAAYFSGSSSWAQLGYPGPRKLD